jgi:probable F420-dependent oxidoreductase
MFPVPPGRRGAVFDESLELLRLLLREESVSFTGQYFTVESASVGPPPVKPLDIWTGGSAPGAFRRAGRLADGWLGSFLTPPESRVAREAIQAAAAEAGREVEADHFGISLAVATDGVPEQLAAAVRQRRPDTDPAALVAVGWADARRMLEEYVDAGLSKFVVRPASASMAPGALEDFLGRFAAELMPLQN